MVGLVMCESANHISNSILHLLYNLHAICFEVLANFKFDWYLSYLRKLLWKKNGIFMASKNRRLILSIMLCEFVCKYTPLVFNRCQLSSSHQILNIGMTRKYSLSAQIRVRENHFCELSLRVLSYRFLLWSKSLVFYFFFRHKFCCLTLKIARRQGCSQTRVINVWTTFVFQMPIGFQTNVFELNDHASIGYYERLTIMCKHDY